MEPKSTQLRMPPDLRERIQAAAAANRRSINAEILFRLERSLSGECQAQAGERAA